MIIGYRCIATDPFIEMYNLILKSIMFTAEVEEGQCHISDVYPSLSIARPTYIVAIAGSKTSLT